MSFVLPQCTCHGAWQLIQVSCWQIAEEVRRQQLPRTLAHLYHFYLHGERGNRRPGSGSESDGGTRTGNSRAQPAAEKVRFSNSQRLIWTEVVQPTWHPKMVHAQCAEWVQQTTLRSQQIGGQAARATEDTRTGNSHAQPAAEKVRSVSRGAGLALVE